MVAAEVAVAVADEDAVDVVNVLQWINSNRKTSIQMIRPSIQMTRASMTRVFWIERTTVFCSMNSK